MNDKKEILVVGAGRLGKGYIGEEFEKAGWQVTFLDKDPQVIENLENGSYQVRIATPDKIYDDTLENYQQILTSDVHEELPAFLSADIVMVPVYPEDLKEVFTYLTTDFKAMQEQFPDKKLDIVLLTNKIYLVNQMYAFLKEELDEALYQWIEAHIFIRDAIIRRSTDAKSNSALDINSMAAASLLIETPLHVSLEDVDWMEPKENVPTLKEIKIYTLNGPHATTAFFGNYKGYLTIPDAETDDEIEALVKTVIDEIYAACMKEFNLSYEDIADISQIPTLKDEVPDTIRRVAYDPIRKLSNNDRLCGPIQLCEKHGLEHQGLDQAVAYGLKYDDKEDPKSVEMQVLIQQVGIFQAVKNITGLSDCCVKKIVNQYEKL